MAGIVGRVAPEGTAGITASILRVAPVMAQARRRALASPRRFAAPGRVGYDPATSIPD